MEQSNRKQIHGGTIRAAAGFAEGGYLIEAATTELREEWEERKREGKRGAGVEAWRARAAFEGLKLRDLTLDGNFSAGGLLLLNALRTTVSNCYVLRFAGSSVGINVQGGHETLVHHSFLGQRVTSGAHPLEPSFSGTAIVLAGNDNAVSDVVVFSAATGIEITGEANILTGWSDSQQAEIVDFLVKNTFVHSYIRVRNALFDNSKQ
jgi:hypothetical protein